MSAETLLSRLDAVRETGADRWMAKCPAHPDKTPSLAVRVTDDGRVLLHDFAGCPPEAVLDAVGLSFSDLMPQRVGIEHRYKPVRPNHWQAARNALRVLSYEVLLVAIAAENLANGIALTDADRDRLTTAASRIRAAQGVVA